nr:MAG TPA: hypothetical protein [Caudoviricetes sp.]
MINLKNNGHFCDHFYISKVGFWSVFGHFYIFMVSFLSENGRF